MFDKIKKIFQAQNPNEENQMKLLEVFSPVSGHTMGISQVNDPTFSNEMLGKGIAIMPNIGRVVAPMNGTVALMFETGHAVSIVGDNGIELLIHIGIDTIKLKGEHFTIHAKTGNTVKTGDLLIEFDLEAIKNKQFDVITPVVILNTDIYKDFDLVVDKQIKESELIISLSK